MQVCVPDDWTDKEVKEFADAKNPCGTTGDKPSPITEFVCRENTGFCGSAHLENWNAKHACSRASKTSLVVLNRDVLAQSAPFHQGVVRFTLLDPSGTHAQEISDFEEKVVTDFARRKHP